MDIFYIVFVIEFIISKMSHFYKYIYTLSCNIIIIIFMVICIIIYNFNIKIYKISNRKYCTIIKKKIKTSIFQDDYELPLGYFIDYFYIGYISIDYIYLISSINTFKSLINNTENINFTDNTENINFTDDSKKFNIDEIKYYVSTDVCYGWKNYIRRNIKIKYISNENQTCIINKIQNFYNENNYCIALIDGNIGKGKTICGYLLAKALHCSICKSYSPIIPGDTIDNLYDLVEPTIKEPLIIILDEFDNILHNIHNNKIIKNEKYMAQVNNKTTWNSFLDDINLGLYPYIILLLISNKNIEELNKKYDPSYIRNKRVNLFFTLH